MKRFRLHGYGLMLCLFSLSLSLLSGCDIPRNTRYIDRIADFDASQGNYKDAIDEYSKAIKYNPLDGEAYMKRGLVYEKMGNHRQAIEDYTKAIEIFPDDSELYVVRGIVYAKANEYQKATYDYTRALELDPMNQDAYLYRAEVYQKTGNNTMAEADLRKAATMEQYKPKKR